MALFGFRRKPKISEPERPKGSGFLPQAFGKDTDSKSHDKNFKSENSKTLASSNSAKTEKSALKTSTTSASDYTGVLIKPRITEKATIIAEEDNVYTFDVRPNTTKKEIAKAVEANYKVKPFKVNISDIKRKKVRSRGKIGMKAGGKKAMVYLKKGDKIEFV